MSWEGKLSERDRTPALSFHAPDSLSARVD